MPFQDSELPFCLIREIIPHLSVLTVRAKNKLLFACLFSKVGMSGKGPAPGTKDGGDEILSVEETVWTLRLGARNPPCNVARFEEMWVGKGSSKRKASGNKSSWATSMGGDTFSSNVVKDLEVSARRQMLVGGKGRRGTPYMQRGAAPAFVHRNSAGLEVTRPPFDDPSVFSTPAYMYREQEVEEHSEDEGFEGPGKFEAFDRPAFKRRVIKTRDVQWVLEDRKDYSKGGGIKYIGSKTVQGSKYATFKVDDLRPNTIEVTPIDQWWLFKKAPRDDGKMMSVKEAEELMKKQENFLGPLSLANKVLGTKSLEAAAAARGGGGGSSRYGDLDREDKQVAKQPTQERATAAIQMSRNRATNAAGVLHEAGVKVGGPEEDLDRLGGGDDSETEGAFGLEKGDVDSDAGGEDDDFGDEVRSDDEEEVGNDDANEGGGTLHQDDEDLNDSEDDFTDDEHHELQKLSRSVNADGEEEDDYTVGGDAGRASPTLSSNGNPASSADSDGSGSSPGGGSDSVASSGKRGASAMRDEGGAGSGAAAGGGGGAGGGTSGGEGGSSKRARKSQKKGSQEINQANVVATLKRYGGRVASKLLLRQFVSALKVDGKPNKAALSLFREILKRVATMVDDAIEGTVWILKSHYS
eukprot:jgi/Undpi1/9635/HiC_scaffold_27.g12091.m1